MLNAVGRRAVSAAFGPMGRALARIGISPHLITLLGTAGVLVGSLGFVTTGNLLVGTIVTTVFAFTDLLDGEVARANGRGSAWGAFLDSTADRVADAAIFASLAFWLASTGRWWACASALGCLAGALLVSYVKARAESLGATAAVGIAERGERMAAIGVIAIVELVGVRLAFEVGLTILALACAVTIGQRMWVVWRQLRARPEGAE